MQHYLSPMGLKIEAAKPRDKGLVRPECNKTRTLLPAIDCDTVSIIRYANPLPSRRKKGETRSIYVRFLLKIADKKAKAWRSSFALYSLYFRYLSLLKIRDFRS
jgi:hypothetical protein